MAADIFINDSIKMAKKRAKRRQINLRILMMSPFETKVRGHKTNCAVTSA